MTILAAAFHEVDTIEMGSGVVPIQVQHPTQLAQRALTLNAIAGGRFTLGIGMSHRMVTEQMWGISYEKPLRRMAPVAAAMARASALWPTGNRSPRLAIRSWVVASSSTDSAATRVSMSARWSRERWKALSWALQYGHQDPR